ncbi:esterase/lipase family protein [Streptomyces poonensis]|uniref:Lipase n=1 Tax=Streptomyces poonensis TaxID=68255 RepID=A0A918PCC2_9ACTN|nr:alpha/beta fold hydrolase [Streptomyces poonensis]GGY98801.1 lipase [Streptomyces poonensis]
MARRTPPAPLRALRILLAAAALAGASLAGAAHAAPPADSAGGWNDYSCRPSHAHPRPVVLVHGTGANSLDNWFVLAPDLARHGYCVFALDYGQVGLPLTHGLGPIERSAGQLGSFVDHVLATTGAHEVDVVGHSQGGMMPRYYLKFLGGADKVHHLIGIAPSNHGTTLHGLAPLVRVAGRPVGLARTFPAVSQQLAGSRFLARLNAGGDTVPGVHYTVLATRYDLNVTPYWSQFLHGPDVRNVLIQDLCPVNTATHESIGFTDRITHHEIRNVLDPAHATPTTCAAALS